MRLEPIGNKVVVRRDPAIRSKGKIILPETGASKSYLGTVVAVGPGLEWEERQTAGWVTRRRVPLVTVDDRVICPDLGGQDVNDWEGPEAVDPVTGERCVVLIIEDDFFHGRVVA